MASQDKNTNTLKTQFTVSQSPVGALINHLSQDNTFKRLCLDPDTSHVRLKEVFALKKGRAPHTITDEFNAGYLPYINIRAFERGEIEFYARANEGIRVEKTDIVMVWDGARSGLIGYGINGILGSTLKKLTIKPEFKNIPQSYFYYFLKSQYRLLNHHARGSVIKHVDTEIFNAIKIPLPDPGSERFELIHNVLSCLDKMETIGQNQLALIKKLKCTVLQSCFQTPS